MLNKNRFSELENWRILNLFLVFFLIITLSYFHFFSNLNSIITDRMYGSGNPLKNIVIVGVDDKTFLKLGSYPLNRDYYAKLINKINQSSVIGFDIGFFERTENDKLLYETFKRYSHKIVLGSYIAINNKFDKKDNEFYKIRTFNPIPLFKNVTEQGYINLEKDPDNVIRRVNFNLSSNQSSFSWVIFKKYFENHNSHIPKLNNTEMIFNYVGRPHSFKYYSMIDILNDKVNHSLFKDKIVLIGVTSPTLHDYFMTPTAKTNLMSGVEIHANIVQTLFLRDNLHYADNLYFYTLIFFIILIFTYFTKRFHLFITAILGITFYMLYLFIVLLFFEHNIILNIVYIFITLVLTIFTNTYLNFLLERKKKKFITKAFEKYLSPEIINEISKDPKLLNLGGKREKVGIFFLDIENFTSIAENISPEKLTSFLNIYLTRVTEIILKRRGLVDKYIGDAVMAFWGAPIKKKNFICDMCYCSLEILDLKLRLREDLGIKDFNYRIGLNYGEVIVGNLGSEERFDYTIIGDAVNLASRLEGLNKVYKTNILVTESIFLKVRTKFVFRPLDYVKVKGKNKSVRIYELICKKERLETKIRRELRLFKKGLELYQNEEFVEALEYFQKAYNLNRSGPTEIYISRCQKRINH